MSPMKLLLLSACALMIEALTIKEIRMQPTARGIQPTVVVSMKLVGTAIAAQVKDAEDKVLLERARSREAKQKSDL